MYLKVGGNSLITIHIGHIDVVEDRKIATPSVFINRDMLAGLSADKKPP